MLELWQNKLATIIGGNLSPGPNLPSAFKPKVRFVKPEVEFNAIALMSAMMRMMMMMTMMMMMKKREQIIHRYPYIHTCACVLRTLLTKVINDHSADVNCFALAGMNHDIIIITSIIIITIIIIVSFS